MPYLETNWDKVNKDGAASELVALEMKGVGRDEICKQLEAKYNFQFTPKRLERLRKLPMYAQTLEEARNILRRTAVARIHLDAVEMVPLIKATLIHHLEQKNLQAVVTAIKILGGESLTEQTSSNQKTNIQVILPGNITLPRNVGGNGSDDKS